MFSLSVLAGVIYNTGKGTRGLQGMIHHINPFHRTSHKPFIMQFALLYSDYCCLTPIPPPSPEESSLSINYAQLSTPSCTVFRFPCNVTIVGKIQRKSILLHREIELNALICSHSRSPSQNRSRSRSRDRSPESSERVNDKENALLGSFRSID